MALCNGMGNIPTIQFVKSSQIQLAREIKSQKAVFIFYQWAAFIFSFDIR
jgi:hypothetical protein